MYDRLRQRLVEGPDDADDWRVLGDWLQQQGDPRGELVQIQLALESTELGEAERRSLKSRETALFDAYGDEWLGPLAAPLAAERSRVLGARVTFRRGYPHTLDLNDAHPDVVAGLAAFEDRDLLRELSVQFLFRGGRRTLDALTELDFPAVADFRYGDGTGSIVEDGAATKLASRMPRLRSLSVSGRRVQVKWLFGLRLNDLRSLSVSCGYEHSLAKLAANPSLEKLETLACYPHALEPGDSEEGYLPLPELTMLARSPRLQALRSLTLWQSSAGDAGIAVLADAGRFEQLEHLDLSYGEITDEGARRIARAPGRLRHVALRFNRLTTAGVEALRQAGIEKVDADQQTSGDPHWYLYQGDIE